MWIEVQLKNKEIIEFWGVRAWSNDKSTLWIYFVDSKHECGYIKGAKVIKSFVSSVNDNDEESLKFLH